jgi:type IX secretion system PorP/SprF family membrane protein
MKKYTRIIFLVTLSISAKYIFAQDPVFSQPYANPLYLNPAYAGTGNSQRFGFNFQDQWPSIPNYILNYTISYDRNFIDSNNGIGFLVNVEKSAFNDPSYISNQALTTTNISLIYAHQFHFESFTLSIGAQATYLNINLDMSKLEYNGPIFWGGWEPFPPGTSTLLRNTITAPDFSGGILGYGKNCFAGFSVDHLTQPDESFYQGESLLAIKYTLCAGAMVPAGSVTFTPTLIYEQQGVTEQTIMELYASLKHITAGLGYIPQDAIIFMLGYQGKLLRVEYSYDCSISKLILATGGVHEGSLALLMPYSKAKRKKVTGLNCPAF